MGYIIGIDVGGSTTKIVGIRDGEITSMINVKADDPVTSAYGAFGKFLNENNLKISDIEKVMFTGVGSSFLKDELYGTNGVEQQVTDKQRERILNAKSPKQCAAYFAQWFERPASNNYSRRQANAERAYAYFCGE